MNPCMVAADRICEFCLEPGAGALSLPGDWLDGRLCCRPCWQNRSRRELLAALKFREKVIRECAAALGASGDFYLEGAEGWLLEKMGLKP